MKSLLIKDFKLMKKNIRYIIVSGFLLGIVFYLNRSDDMTVGYGFLVGYMSFSGMLTAIRTISMDEDNNANAFLFTLPFSRKTYVIEKYIFCFLIGIICFIVSLIIVFCLSILKHQLNVVVTLYTAACVFSIMTILTDVMIPVELRFGRYKSRFILVALILVFIILSQVLGFLMITYGNKSSFFANMTYTQLLLYLYFLAFIILLISILVSQKIVKRKDF